MKTTRFDFHRIDRTYESKFRDIDASFSTADKIVGNQIYNETLKVKGQK